MDLSVKEILEKVKSGDVSVEDAFLALKAKPFEDIGFAKIDTHRRIRQGAGEVIYGAGKTPQQIVSIVRVMKDNGQDRILITRIDEDKAKSVSEKIDMRYLPEASIGIVGTDRSYDGLGTIVIATGGTSDIPVAEEAADKKPPLASGQSEQKKPGGNQGKRGKKRFYGKNKKKNKKDNQ